MSPGTVMVGVSTIAFVIMFILLEMHMFPIVCDYWLYTSLGTFHVQFGNVTYLMLEILIGL